MAGMAIRRSSRNSATNILEYTHQKLILTHTLRCQPGNSLEGWLTNTRMRVIQMSHNGRNGDPNVVSKFSYKYYILEHTHRKVMLTHTLLCQP